MFLPFFIFAPKPNQKNMNNIKDFEKYLPDFKSGKTFEFKLLNLKKRKEGIIVPQSVRIPSTAVIFNPEKNEKVSISCVEQEIPISSTETKTILKDVVFNKSERGRKFLHGSNKGDLNLFQFLCLANQNKANIDKPYHIPPKNGYVYELVNKEEAVKRTVEDEKKIAMAKGLVFQLNERSKILVFCEKLSRQKFLNNPFSYSENMTDDELLTKLSVFANDARNAEKIISLNEDVTVAIEELINDAEANKIIDFDKDKKRVVWADSREPFLSIPKGKNYKVALTDYLISKEGDDVRQTIIRQLKNINEES